MLITMHQKTRLDCILSLSSVFKKERKIPIWEVQLAPSPCWCKLVTESSWRRNCQSVWGDIWEQLNGWRDLDWRRRGGSCIELELSKCPDQCCAQYKSWKSKRDQTISRVFLPPVALASHNKSTVVLLALQVATQICPLDKKFCWPMNHWARSSRSMEEQHWALQCHWKANFQQGPFREKIFREIFQSTKRQCMQPLLHLQSYIR